MFETPLKLSCRGCNDLVTINVDTKSSNTMHIKKDAMKEREKFNAQR